MKIHPDIKTGAILSNLFDSELFAGVAAAQAILETGNGSSGLSANHNNYFGIKAGTSWKGKTVQLNTQEHNQGTVSARFRAYPSSLDSFRDRNLLFRRLSVYRPVLEAKTPIDQIEAIHKSPYATDPNYGSKLKRIYDQYNLANIDKSIPIIRVGLITALGALILAT